MPRAVWLVIAAAAFGGCTPSLAKDSPSRDIGRGRRLTHNASAAGADGGRAPSSLGSHLIATVADRTVGPLLARGAAGKMAAYLGAGPNGTRRIVSIPLRADDSPLEAHVIATAGADSTTFVFRPSGGGGDGFVAAWTDLTDRGEALSIGGVGKDGAPAAPAVEVARTTNDIVWVEIVPTPRGSVCVWAEETRAGGADVSVVALEPSGKPHGVASRVAQGVVGWQALPTVAGVALGLVVPAPAATGARPSDPRGSSVTLLKLDTEGRPVSAPITVASSTKPITDADVTRSGNGFVFAWTDHTGTDPAVMTAFVDGEGKAQPGRLVTTGSGGATLTAIVGGASGVLLGWEEARKQGRSMRRLHLTRLDASGAAMATTDTVVEVDGTAAPELVAGDPGFALLARVRACPDPPAPRDPPCADAPIVPAVVRLDAQLAIQSTEPLRVTTGHDATPIAWGLGCEHDRCSALAATGEAPVRVSVVDFEPGSSRFRAPVPQPIPPGAPRIESVETLATSVELSDLAVATVGEQTFLVSLGAAPDEPGAAGHKKTVTPGVSVVTLRTFAPGGKLQGPPVTLSRHALSVGGVAISAGGKPEDGAAVAWVSLDEGDGEVHVARIDSHGKPQRDVRLTMTKGDASDVGIAWAEGGWLLAWVDTRDGNGEVYASKVGLDLQRLARDERITNAPGDASDVTLLGGAREGGAWLAWADPRESPHDGFADIFVTTLRARDARPMFPESRVLPTAAHSRSPSLTHGEGDGAVIGWIEEAPMGVEATSGGAYGAMIAWLDDKGHGIGDPLRTHGAGEGAPTAIVLDRAGAQIHAVVARSARDEVALDAFSPQREATGTPFPILGLDGPPSLDVSMTLLGGTLYFNDDVPETGGARARAAKLLW